MRRVEALEVEALTSARERRPSPVYAGGYNPHSPALWAPERLNTILRYRAGLERSLHRTLKALEERRAARAEAEKGTNEPETRAPAPPRTNEPETGTVGPAAGDAPSDAPRATGAADAEQAARTNPGRPCHAGGRPAKAGREPRAKKRKKPARRRTRGVKPRTASPPCGPCRHPRA